MSKAKEKALEVYPKSEKYTTSQRLIINDLRDGFIQGYEQAEKDLALTWEDIHRLAIIEDNLIHELCIKDDTMPTTQSFYEEVLKRFKKAKG